MPVNRQLGYLNERAGEVEVFELASDFQRGINALASEGFERRQQ